MMAVRLLRSMLNPNHEPLFLFSRKHRIPDREVFAPGA
jgi:hypothetical protein